jgi:hypothetical protein
LRITVYLLLLQVVVDYAAVAVGQALQRRGGEPGEGGAQGPHRRGHGSCCCCYRVGLLSGNSLADFWRIPPAAPSKSFGGFLPSSSVYIDVQYIKIRSRKSYVLLLAMYFFLIAKRVKNSDVSYIIIASIKKIRIIYLRQCPSNIPHKEKILFFVFILKYNYM